MSQDSLGEPIRVIRPALTTIITGLILSMIPCGIGVGVIIGTISGYLPRNDIVDVWWGLLVSGGILVAGLALFYNVFGLLTFRLVICEKGFYTKCRGKLRVFPFDEIKEVHETILYSPYLIAKGVQKLFEWTKLYLADRSYRIVRQDDVVLDFDRDRVPKPKLFIMILQEEAECRNIPWIIHK